MTVETTGGQAPVRWRERRPEPVLEPVVRTAPPGSHRAAPGPTRWRRRSTRQKLIQTEAVYFGVGAVILLGYWAGLLDWWKGLNLALLIGLVLSLQFVISIVSTFLWIRRTDEGAGAAAVRRADTRFGTPEDPLALGTWETNLRALAIATTTGVIVATHRLVEPEMQRPGDGTAPRGG